MKIIGTAQDWTWASSSFSDKISRWVHGGQSSLSVSWSIGQFRVLETRLNSYLSVCVLTSLG